MNLYQTTLSCYRFSPPLRRSRHRLLIASRGGLKALNPNPVSAFIQTLRVFKYLYPPAAIHILINNI